MALEATLDAPTGTKTETPAPAQSEKVGSASARASKFPEAFGEIEELEQAQPKAPEKPAPAAPKPAPAKPPVPAAAKPAGAEKPAAKPPGATEKPVVDPKAADKPVEKPAGEGEAAAGDIDVSAKFVTAHDLRKEYNRLYKSVKERETEIAQLKSKTESQPVAAAALEEHKAMKKRLDEAETELKYVAYTKSQEFRDKFEKPYEEAYDDAVEEIKELRVTAPDGSSRMATVQDFQKIMSADISDVRELATNMFGEAAGDVLANRRKLIELNKAANREAKRYREEAGERERQKALKAAEEKDGMEKLWNKAVTDIKERYPEYFGHIDGDDEYNKELDAGYQIVDKAHHPGLPLEEKIARLAALRHRAAAFRAQVLLNKRLKDRVSELEGVVQEYEKSAPSAGAGSEGDRVSNGEAPDSFASAMDELEELGRKDTTT